MLTALLLGAGASRELGMPLRSEINAELTAWLSPAALRRLNDTWRSRGFGHPPAVIADVAGLLDEQQFDYEHLLAHLEARYLDDARDGFAQAYHALYAWLAQIVYQLLYRRQVERRDAYREGLQYFEGLVPLARQNRPLWIFSLNHDVLIECIAALFGIELNCGFPQRTRSLPCRNAAGQVIARLAVQVLTDAELAEGALPFCVPGWPGINLLKLHGALDTFSLDGRGLLRIKPPDDTFDAIIDALQIANEGLLDPTLAASLIPDPLALSNQIPWLDDQGTLRLLGRTLRASTARLSDPCPQLMQRRRLEYFRGSLAQIGRLVAIGYSLTDAEVNEIVLDWLANDPGRHLEVVGPGPASLPGCFAPHGDQIELTAASATTYLERFL